MSNYIPRNQPRAGEITLKQWLCEMAGRHHVCPNAVWSWCWLHHTMPAPKLRRVNRRVIFVLADTAERERAFDSNKPPVISTVAPCGAAAPLPTPPTHRKNIKLSPNNSCNPVGNVG